MVLCIVSAIYSISGLAPNFQIIQKACIASSDYFTILKNDRQLSLNYSDYIPSKENFRGKIEFKNVKFIYPSDTNGKYALDGLNILIIIYSIYKLFFRFINI